MPAVLSSGQASEKWSRVTPQRTEDYSAGVKSPRVDWAQATAAAAAAQAAGVQEAIKNKSFEKGVQKAGSSKWQAKAAGVGADRFGQGVQAAKGEYEAGVAPFLQVIGSTTLPPKYAKGDPRNIERVRAMAKALRDAKVRGV